MTRNPNWTIEETILCLDFYFRYRPSIPVKGSDELNDLHDLIQKHNKINGIIGTETHRNENGVYMKIMNLMTLDESTEAGLPRNSKVDHLVWSKFPTYSPELKKIAEDIRFFIDTMS